MSLPSTLHQEPFEYRGLKFRWAFTRSGWVTGLALARPPALSHWIFVQDQSAHYVAWVEFDGGGYTEPCSMPTREEAIDGALHALIDYCVAIVTRIGELP